MWPRTRRSPSCRASPSSIRTATSYTAPGFPVADERSVRGHRLGTLKLTGGGGSGPPTVAANAAAANAVDAVAYAVTPAPAANAVTVTVPLDRDAVVVGAPKLSLTYSGTVPTGDRPTRVFAQLVDPGTGIVVNNQITPIRSSSTASPTRWSSRWRRSATPPKPVRRWTCSWSPPRSPTSRPPRWLRGFLPRPREPADRTGAHGAPAGLIPNRPGRRSRACGVIHSSAVTTEA